MVSKRRALGDAQRDELDEPAMPTQTTTTGCSVCPSGLLASPAAGVGSMVKVQDTVCLGCGLGWLMIIFGSWWCAADGSLNQDLGNSFDGGVGGANLELGRASSRPEDAQGQRWGRKPRGMVSAGPASAGPSVHYIRNLWQAHNKLARRDLDIPAVSRCSRRSCFSEAHCMASRFRTWPTAGPMVGQPA